MAQRGLPTSDLQSNLMEGFLVAVNDAEEVVGCVGVQRFGKSALVRSLAVSPSNEKLGLGRLLLLTLEKSCFAQGVCELWLLTMNAAGFFTAAGYAPTDKDAAPAALQFTEQFASICPASARCLMKRLGPS
ncbi:arsenic resistance N-acetyltransferase ArsN2 [Caballeronia arvi]|uniref:arsenic resistance N-acetyltransferase ArsN2 n=1 Tax=Caballeronia arvi TaxID=1777135 RepID=UPI00135CB836